MLYKIKVKVCLMLKKQDLTEVEKEVLGELGDRLGIEFRIGSGDQRRVVLSNETVKVKITDAELKRRLRAGKPVSYQVKWIKCGKKNCSKCLSSPGHGPYIYAFWRDGKKVKSRYLGKLGE